MRVIMELVTPGPAGVTGLVCLGGPGCVPALGMAVFLCPHLFWASCWGVAPPATTFRCARSGPRTPFPFPRVAPRASR